jgi:nicotinamidase-related amidase
VRIIVPHHQWKPGDFAGWQHMSPTQVAANGAYLFAAGEWGGEFRPEFAPREHDVVASQRWGSSGFANTDLNLHLTQRGISHLVLIGIRANTCIDTTARYAQELGYHVTLISDAIGAFSMPEITATFELNAPTYAHSIRTTAELIDILG